MAAIADEGVALSYVNRHYEPEEFINVLVWAIAHELCHLLVGINKTYSPATALMSHSIARTWTDGITIITAEREEIGDINLKARHSIKKGN